MKLRILVVDDDTEFTELLQFNLERQDCQLLIAHDGIEGLRLARTELPNLILLDLMLPGLGGLTVCEVLRNRPSTSAIPVFIISALDERWAELQQPKATYTQFFRKPLDFRTLRESIRSACAPPSAPVVPREARLRR